MEKQTWQTMWLWMDNDKVFTLGLWIGNKDTSEIIFTEQLAIKDQK